MYKIAEAHRFHDANTCFVSLAREQKLYHGLAYSCRADGCCIYPG